MIVKGATGATLTAVRRGEDKSAGPFVEYIFEGTEDAINGTVGDLDGTQDGYTVSNVGPRWSVAVRYGNNEILGTTETPTREEKLHWNRTTKSIYEHERYGSLNAEAIAEVRRAVDAKTAMADEATELQKELHKFVIKGVESTSVNQPVLIITETATNAAILPATFANVGSIYTRTAMANEVGLQASWAGILPQGVGNDDFSYGWQKGPPEYSVTGAYKQQLIQEFSYGFWPVQLFSFVS